MNTNVLFFKLTKGWKNMIDVQPGFYEGVDGYEQACRYHTLSETVYYEKVSGIAVS